jgi:hypothetical protein
MIRLIMACNMVCGCLASADVPSLLSFVWKFSAQVSAAHCVSTVQTPTIGGQLQRVLKEKKKLYTTHKIYFVLEGYIFAIHILTQCDE